MDENTPTSQGIHHVSRRRFVSGVGQAALIATASLATRESRASSDNPSPATTPPTFDVVVAGGGTAGAIAAIQASRLGSKTLLVEAGGQLGGTTTTAGVSFPGLFHAWGKQVIAGIGWELVHQCVQLDSGILPDFSTIPRAHWMHQIKLNGPLYAALLEEAFLQAGGIVAFHEIPNAVKILPNGYKLSLVGKDAERTVHCKQLIDCTGDANLVGKLGFQRLREETTQPGTMMFEFGDYDPRNLDANLIEQHYRAALAEKRLLPGDVSKPNARFIEFLRSRGSNNQHLLGVDGSSSSGKTQANLAGRQSVLRLLRFIRSLPGCENTRLLRMQTEAGIRETFRIVGETIISEMDYRSGRVFEDAVCHSFYPIDIHDEHGVTPEPLAQGTVPTIPLKALIPKGSRHLLAAGRCISSDRAANSALRVQASCMAMGQAAGAAAALAAKSSTTPDQVSIAQLRAVLKDHGAIVPQPI